MVPTIDLLQHRLPGLERLYGGATAAYVKEQCPLIWLTGNKTKPASWENHANQSSILDNKTGIWSRAVGMVSVS